MLGHRAAVSRQEVDDFMTCFMEFARFLAVTKGLEQQNYRNCFKCASLCRCVCVSEKESQREKGY